MHHLKNIVVALDLSKMDESVMDYLSYFTKALLPDSLTFVHVIPEHTIPEGVFASKEDKQDYQEKHKAETRKKLEALIERHWGHRSDIKPALTLLEGNPLKELLHFLQSHPYDLLVVGKKKVSSGSGIVAHKLARRIEGSILFVPTDAPKTIERMLLPVDFSKDSLAAAKMAVQLSPLLDDPTLQVIHVYDVPPAVSIKIGRTPEQFSQMIRANVEEAMQKFIEKITPGKAHVKTDLVYNKHTSPSRQLIDYAEVNQMSLIMIGAKGHTLLESLFLGSVTEKIILSPLPIPILIVRRKDEAH